MVWKGYRSRLHKCNDSMRTDFLVGTGAGGRQNYLNSDDLLLFARGDGHTLSMLLNSAFALPAFKKAATPATFPSFACCFQVPAIFLHMAMSRSESNVSAHLWA
jgi:hypothetical protein